MAALAADVNGSLVGHYNSGQYVANADDTYYRGSIVYIDTAGGVQVTAAAGDRVLGYSPRRQTVLAGELVEVVTDALVWFPLGAGSMTAAMEGEILQKPGATDTDNPADFDAGAPADADVALGRIKRVTATQMQVEIGAITGMRYDGTLGSWV